MCIASEGQQLRFNSVVFYSTACAWTMYVFLSIFILCEFTTVMWYEIQQPWPHKCWVLIVICLELSALISYQSTASLNHFCYQVSNIRLSKNKIFVKMCIHIFVGVESLIKKNIHEEIQNKNALEDTEPRGWIFYLNHLFVEKKRT